MKTAKHDVVSDYAGFNETIFRLTCRTCDAKLLSGSTLVKHEHYSDAKWQAARDAFLAKHPCQTVRSIS